jgi:sulfite dehydrogenase (cytochrome) subunit B
MKPRLRLVLALCAMLPAGFAGGASEESIRLQDAPGRDLVVARCSVCHSVDYVQMNAPVFDRTGWQKSVRKMIDVFGAPISEDDASRIVEYLGNNY